MRKIIPHILLLLLSVGLSTGCVYWHMSHLSDEELAWTGNFVNNDSCLFLSNRGNISRMRIAEHYTGNTRNPFYFSSNTRDEYEAISYVKFLINQKGEFMEGCLQIKKLLPANTTRISGKLGRRGYTGSRYDSLPDSPMAYIKSFTMDNRVFPECFVMDSLNSNIIKPDSFNNTPTDVRSMIISKEYGLIYYSFEDGEEYFRVFNK